MSRAKSRIQTDVCGDCGGADPSWASINRGILLCADCCSIHRSLGRHISQVKSLRQGSWQVSVLNFVNQLNAHGANSVWEHLLLDSVSPKNLKRKPTPKDAVHPTKADFIRAKHVNLAYVLKPSFQVEEGSSLELELSKQLHASVRAGNLETSLRLLVQGADPNFFHEDKGSTPLHVAVKSGQLSQIELLLVYGADVTAHDAQGNSPLELARQAKNSVIAERLLEAMYEVTDRLTFFLIGKKPNHAAGQHLLIPDQSKKEMSEQLKIARGKLQLVPNRMFEELVMDLYDEVDRRETEAIWATSALNPESGAVPFLPTNPHLSATRNQGRQKLARFSQPEFAGLLMDVLLDAHRRQNMANLRPIDGPLPAGLAQLKISAMPGARDSNLSDDEPLYDAVASDDDYAALAPVAQQALVNKSSPAAVSNVEVETLRQRIQDQELTINELRSMIHRLASENSQLKSHFDTQDHEVQLRNDPTLLNGATGVVESSPDAAVGSRQTTPSAAAVAAAAAAAAAYAKRPVSMYETRQAPRSDESRPPITQSLYSMAPAPNPGAADTMMSHNLGPEGSSSGGGQMPPFEEVKHRTDAVARRIKELFAAMKDLAQREAFIPCAERIRLAVVDLMSLFPGSLIANESIRGALQQLNYHANLIQAECARLQQCLAAENGQLNGGGSPGGASQGVGKGLGESIQQSMEQVRGCAYELAMSTKILITHVQQS
ncbi:ARF GTPase-activating protein Git [Anopheles ziemanni]|uniref:ARF GTPase-activating protein Git n=1 Tax=Anopheles coustani TaxID=139045 RepID=UPI0026590157|nr:ARF GTPase-activating protein Git [Anopheles coustani]XP_058175515.1 ARF GTPase-activating protein Git [Anopheles ziemanni]